MRRLLVLASLLLVAASSSAAEAFLRSPAIHGDTIAFVAEGDIWIASALNGEARRLTSHDAADDRPLFSPDGSELAFVGSYDGGPDLYVIGVQGGSPRRLTWDNTNGVRPVAWSADGKNIIFRSTRRNAEWRNRLWSVPAAGGLPTLLPIPRAEHAAVDAPGRRVAFVPISGEWQHWKHYRGGQADDVWLADLQSGAFRRLTNDPAIDTTPIWIGDQLYIASDRDGISNLYRVDLNSGAATKVTKYNDYDLLYPSTDGKRVVYEHGNTLGIYDPASGTTSTLPIRLTSDRIHARERRVVAKENLRSASLGPTGKRVLAEARGQIVTLPVGQGDWRIIENTSGARAQYPAWSPDGKWIAFVSDRSGEEQVWITPASGTGQPRQLTKDHTGPLGTIVWSPDNKRLVTSDREMRILLVDVATGAVTVVAQGTFGPSYNYVVDSYRFSPDGKWITYSLIEPNWNDAVWLYNIEKKENTRLTSSTMASWSPSFDPSGKYLYFLSRRELRAIYSIPNSNFGFDKSVRVSVIALAADTKSPFLKLDEEEGIKSETPAAAKTNDAKKDETAKKKEGELPEVKVDIAGIAERIADVPISGDRFVALTALEDRLLLSVEIDPADSSGDKTKPRYQLRALPLKDPQKIELTTVAEKITAFDVSADGKKLLVRTGNDLAVGASDSAPLKEPAAIPIDQVMLAVDPPAEWKQMFDETWRIARDFFYDPNMHGVDWPAVKKKYAAKVPAIGHRSELNIVIGDMIAELNVGHAYVFGGDIAPVSSVPTGRLGADLEADAGGKAWRIVRILPGDPFDLENRSPLLAPGVNVKAGEYIVAVAGRPVSANQPIESMLVGAAGRLVPISVNSKPDLAGARTVLVRPMASEGRLRYYEWLEQKRQYVRKHGGNIAYVQLPNMSDRGLQEFTKQYYPGIESTDGVIVDLRNNGGGWISANLLSQIADVPRVWFKPRYGSSWNRVSWATPGYRVAMCDDQSYSNAEEFCDSFQRMKLGPVVGSRTWGGEVGSGDGYPLIDGGAIYIPNYAAWSPEDGWIIEGSGVVPDIDVEQDPAALLAGRDPQLDRAIAYIREQIARKPVVHPKPPVFPKKSFEPAPSSR